MQAKIVVPTNMRFGGIPLPEDIEKMAQIAKKEALKVQPVKSNNRKEEETAEKQLAEMKKRIIDAEGVPLDEALSLVWLHENIAPGDKGPVSIKNMKEFLETVVKPANPAKYKKTMQFFDINRIQKSDRVEETAYRPIAEFLNRFRTIENAFEYSIAFKSAAISMAYKLEAPEDMPVVERVKWLKIWFAIIREQGFFWFDFNHEGKIDSLENIRMLEKTFVDPDLMIALNQSYFANMPDREIQLDLIKKFLNLYPEYIQKEVFKYGEFGYNRQYMELRDVRMNIKRKLFNNCWGIKSRKLFTKEGIRHFEPEIFYQLDKVWRNGGIESLKEEKLTVINPYNSFKDIEISIYEYMELEKEGVTQKLCVTCQEELEMYIIVYRWLQRHPDFRFGNKDKTLKEYEMEHLFEDEVETMTVDDAMKQWLLDFKLANYPEDIDWDEIHQSLDSEIQIDVLTAYLNGEMLKEEVFAAFGFSNMKEAKYFFRKSSKKENE